MLRCSALFPLFRGVALFWWCSVIPVLFCCSAGVVFRVRNRCRTPIFPHCLALFQCFVILPVLYRSAPLFCFVSIVPGCSVVPVVFCYSAAVLSFSGCSVFWCSGGVPLFCPFTGVPCSVVPVFLVL